MVGYGASYFWPAPEPQQIDGLTIWTRQKGDARRPRSNTSPPRAEEERPLLEDENMDSAMVDGSGARVGAIN